MSNIMKTADFANAIDPAFRKHFVDRYKATKPELEKFMLVEDQKDKNEKEGNYTGLATMPTVVEGDNYTIGKRIQGYTATFTPVKKGEVVQITYEMQKWSKTKEILNLATAQADQISRIVNSNAASMFNNAFDTAKTCLSDAKPLCSTAHPRADGGTAQSNASGNGIVLSAENLEVAKLIFESILDDRGQEVSHYADTLIVPPALRATALAIAKSELKVGSPNNDINIQKLNSLKEYQGATLDSVLVWNYLRSGLSGSDTQWFLTSSLGKKGLVWKWADKPLTNEKSLEQGWLSDSIYYKARAYFSFGWNDWRGIWGSKGNATAYTD